MGLWQTEEAYEKVPRQKSATSVGGGVWGGITKLGLAQ